MVAPTIGVGMAQHHMAFPGTVTFRPSTLMLVIRDMVQSLAEHGFERFLFINGHGGHVAAVKAAFYEIHAEARACRGAEAPDLRLRSEEHTSELQSLMRTSYAAFCLKQKN